MVQTIGAAAGVEILTGLALAVGPDMVARLLLRVGLEAGGVAVARSGGVGLVCFGLACWPGTGALAPAARRAMLVFQPTVALVLAMSAINADLYAMMLWPAVLCHAGASVVLARCR